MFAKIKILNRDITTVIFHCKIKESLLKQNNIYVYIYIYIKYNCILQNNSKVTILILMTVFISSF